LAAAAAPRVIASPREPGRPRHKDTRTMRSLNATLFAASNANIAVPGS
jgi:hypothetical protein